MSKKEVRLRKALAKIAEIINAEAADLDESSVAEVSAGNGAVAQASEGCVLRSLPTRLLVAAARTASQINPVNAPPRGLGSLGIEEPMRIAILTSRYWGAAPRTLTVSFMEPTPVELRRRIISDMNAWQAVNFVDTQGTGQVRISRGPGGYWSYLGSDILHIPPGRPTMNLEGFTMATPESEYRRVVRHEAGHTLGFVHEHMRKELVDLIDPEKAYEYFLRTQGWDRAMVDQQVLRSLDQSSIQGTPADETSIMCYQLPGSITRDGNPILGGIDINETDYAFARKIYPNPAPRRVPHRGGPASVAEDWPESEDVTVPV